MGFNMLKVREGKGVFTLKELVERSPGEYRNKTALQYKEEGEWRRISYKKLGSLVNHFGAGLVNLGMGKEDRVAILSENRPEWAIAYLSAASYGGVNVPIDAQLKKGEIWQILKDSASKFLIVSCAQLNKVKEIDSKLPELRSIVVIDDHEGYSIDDFVFLSLRKKDKLKAFQTFEGVMNSGKILEEGKDYSRKVSLDDLVALIYTSGTTGKPKGVMLSHRNIMSNVNAAYQVIPYGEADNFLSVLPLHHTLECTAGFLVPLFGGATISYVESTAKIAENMQEVKPTIMIAVPKHYDAIYKGIMRRIKSNRLANMLYNSGIGRKLIAKGVLRRLGGKLRFFVSGGAPLEPELIKNYKRLGISLAEGYGLTETSPILTANPLTKIRAGSVGLPLPGVEIRIDNPGEDGIGEIVAKGDNVMLGYYKDPEKTKAILRDEWLYTGDAGYIDKNGYLHITGRRKNVIVTEAGKNVYPEEVENELLKSRFIQDVLVIGYTKVNALVRPDLEELYAAKGKEVSDKRIEDIIKGEVNKYCKNLAPYKRVAKIKLWYEEFPKTTTLKTKRAIVLRELADIE